MLFLLLLALFALRYANNTRILALVYALFTLIVSAYFIGQSSDSRYQTAAAVAAVFWLALLVQVYRRAAKLDRLRLQKG